LKKKAMLKYPAIVIICSIINAASALGGVYRHDVPVKKYRELAAQPQFDCVGEVLSRKGAVSGYQNNGSCVFIGGRYVLSAAHIFIEAEAMQDTMHRNGQVITLYKNVDPHVGDIAQYYFRFKGKIYAGRALTIHPVYLSEATKGECDLAIIELMEDVAGVAPAMLNRDPDEAGSVYTGVGYGASGKASEPEHVGSRHERIAGENTIDSLGGYVLNGRPTKMYSDFDHPSNTACNHTGSATPLSMEYVTAGGDSGGGCFRKDSKGKWLLIGIGPGGGTDIGILFKTGYYGQMMDWRRVSVFYDWIQQTTKGSIP
jgi:hypothetical protein